MIYEDGLKFNMYYLHSIEEAMGGYDIEWSFTISNKNVIDSTGT